MVDGHQTAIRRGGADDLVWVGEAHHALYVATGMYNEIFDEHVARTFTPFRQQHDPALDAVWIARQAGRDVGAIAIQHDTDREGWAKLRWFFVLPDARGLGLGKRLLNGAIGFAAGAGYEGITLWTMEGLDAARALYEQAGFRLVEEADAPWHDHLRQQQFELEF